MKTTNNLTKNTESYQTKTASKHFFKPVPLRSRKYKLVSTLNGKLPYLSIDETFSDYDNLAKVLNTSSNTDNNQKNSLEINLLLKKYNIKTDTHMTQNSREFFGTGNNFYETKALINKASFNDSKNEMPTEVVENIEEKNQIYTALSSLNKSLEKKINVKHFDQIKKDQYVLSRMPQVTVSAVTSADNKILIQKRFTTLNDNKMMRNLVKNELYKQKLLMRKLEFEIKPVSSSTTRPFARYRAAAVMLKNKLILVNGLGCQILDDVWEASYNSSNGTVVWNKLKLSFLNYLPVYGHSCCAFGNVVFVFGGVNAEGISANLYQLDLITKSMVLKKTNSMWGLGLARKYHVAVSFGVDMLIHGGVGEGGEVQGSAFYFDTVFFKWSKIFFENDDLFLSEHAACVVSSLRKSPKELNLYNIESFFSNRQNFLKRTANDGIYLFGGANRQNELSDCMYRIKIGSYPLYWELVETKGKGPGSRKGMNMVLFEDLRTLVVSGGMAEEEERILNSLYLFSVDVATWVSVPLRGVNLLNVYGHVSVVIENDILLFGGRNSYKFSGNNVFCIGLS